MPCVSSKAFVDFQSGDSTEISDQWKQTSSGTGSQGQHSLASGTASWFVCWAASSHRAWPWICFFTLGLRDARLLRD